MFICMQNINFITHFFLQILQKNNKLLILDNLGIPGHTHLKWEYQFEEAFDSYLQKLHPLGFTWDIAKILQTCYFGYFGYAWLRTPKKIKSTWKKRLCLSADKKSTSSLMFCWRYYKDMQTSLFWVLWACLGTQTENDSSNLYKASISKNKLHHSFLPWDITFYVILVLSTESKRGK